MDLVGRHLTPRGEGAANTDVKVASLVAGMVAGGDSIDLDLLRHGGMGRLFERSAALDARDVPAGVNLRARHRLDAVAARVLAGRAAWRSAFHAHPRLATIRTHLINVLARLARGTRRLLLHLPEHWPRQSAFERLYQRGHGARDNRTLPRWIEAERSGHRSRR